MKINFTLLFYILFLTPGVHADNAFHINKTTSVDTGLIEWKLIDENFQLQLVQRLPDQTRSFFEARGFNKAITNKIATSCVFQSIIHNTSKDKSQRIHVALKDWRIKINQKTLPIKLKEQWNKEWKSETVKPSSRIAFRWATFPSEQFFEPSGDYNWGMISFGPAPGETFDLNVIWETNQIKKSVWIKNIICPEDQ